MGVVSPTPRMFITGFQPANVYLSTHLQVGKRVLHFGFGIKARPCTITQVFGINHTNCYHTLCAWIVVYDLQFKLEFSAVHSFIKVCRLIFLAVKIHVWTIIQVCTLQNVCMESCLNSSLYIDCCAGLTFRFAQFFRSACLFLKWISIRTQRVVIRAGCLWYFMGSSKTLTYTYTDFYSYWDTIRSRINIPP